MRSGGANATFTQQVSPGRVDITITRSADATGASGTGLLGAVLFDAVAPGISTLTLSGSATGPGGTPMGLQFRPVVGDGAAVKSESVASTGALSKRRVRTNAATRSSSCSSCRGSSSFSRRP